MASKIATVVSEAMNNNIVINACLGLSFVILGIRSENQQKQIEALKEEKDSLIASNKATRTAMWDWKQQLFAEAAAAGDSAVVSLTTLKEIYGEVLTPAQSGDTAQEDPKSPAPFVV